MTSEKDVKAKIKKLLDKHGWFFFMPPANGYGKAGIADILALKAGVFLAIEAKFGKNQPSPMQVAFLNSIRAEDGFAFVVNESSVEWLEAWLGAFNRSSEAVGRQQQVTHEDGATMIDAIRAMTMVL